jgi:hypothetical protein
MAYDGSLHDELNPQNSTPLNEGDDAIRDVKIGLRSRLAFEHIWPSSQTSTSEAGLHSHITFKNQAAAPTLVVGTNTQVGALYVTANALRFLNSASTAITVVASGGYSALPPGTIMPYGATGAAPTGFYKCAGTAVSRATDAALFAIIGTYYGIGDNSTTFNVPTVSGLLLGTAVVQAIIAR